MVNHKQFALVLLFSVLIVWSHWNLFSNGVGALGFNFSLFWVGFSLIIYSLDTSYSLKKDWVWLCPIILIVSSYSFYENPWLKLISLFILPVIVSVFCAYSHFPDRIGLYWNRKLLLAIAARTVKPWSSTGKAFDELVKTSRIASTEAHATHAGTLKRAASGILILIPLSLIVILLLSSADDAFGEIVLLSVRATLDSISWQLLWKLVLSVLLTIALLSIAVGWSESITYSEPAEPRAIDGLVAGIVLGGLLLIYIAFLVLQLDNLVVDTLPENYREAERMVKSGFWQLFLLAVLNTGLFFIVYRKTGAIAQWVLRVFIIASGLLMVSATWKVWLYSYTFGLSYEKFFACYTAIFALAVLLYLVAASFSTLQRNVVKTIAFAALWGYGVATISPIEKVIFHTNLSLAEQDNTRIIVDQLTQLSLDIMEDVDKVSNSKLAEYSEDLDVWRRWRVEQEHKFCARAWYEMNLSAGHVCP